MDVDSMLRPPVDASVGRREFSVSELDNGT